MNSRERIIAAVNHRSTDVLPIDFGAMRSTCPVSAALAVIR